MEEKFKVYEKTIKKKHSINWTPNYKEEFRTSLNKTVFIPIVEKVLQKLDWNLVFKDENSIEAKRKVKSLGFEQYTEAITISYYFGVIKVKSESLGNEMWDFGRNSKRVKLFIFAFKETEKEFDRNALNELEEETEKKNNWDDYVIPENLPKPKIFKKPNFYIPLIGGIIISFIIGFIIAEVSLHVVYIIGLFEIFIGIAIAISLNYLVKLSNFTNLKKLHLLLIAMVFVIFISNEYFQYEIILSENNYDKIGFFEFIKIRLSEGLTINKLTTSWIGLVISWIIQLIVTYFIGNIMFVSLLLKYQLNKIPDEVVEFAYYHLIKEKSKDEIRNELAKKGWTEIKNQNEVFDAIVAIFDVKELNRMN